MENISEMNAMPVQKIAYTIGDGVNSLFTIEHPFDHDYVYQVYRNSDFSDVELGGGSTREKGKLIISFATTPAVGEFTVVLIG